MNDTVARACKNCGLASCLFLRGSEEEIVKKRIWHHWFPHPCEMMFSLTTHDFVSYYKIKPRIGNVLVSIIQINLTSSCNGLPENHNGLTLYWLLHDCQFFIFIGRISAMVRLLALIALNLPPPQNKIVIPPIIWEALLLYTEFTKNLCRWLLY